MLNYHSIAEVWQKTAQELLSPPIGTKLAWWPKFNQILGGLRPYELTLLCAPTGAGKTQLLANVSAQLALQKKPHFVAPVETGDSDFVARIVSCLERRDLNTGEPVDGDLLVELTKKYSQTVFSTPILISKYDNRVDVDEMIATLKYMVSEYRCEVAILDNLNFFLKPVSSQMERAEMDSAIHEFVMFVKKLPMHVILVMHPKKNDNEGRVESEFDIKGSSTAVQEASNVCLFNRPRLKDIESGKASYTDRELVFKKIRKRGVNVNKTILFGFDGGRYLEAK